MTDHSRTARFFYWLGHPFRATRALFPYSSDGRATLIYLFFVGSAVVLTTALLYMAQTVLAVIRTFDAPAINRLDRYAEIATLVIQFIGWGLIISIMTYACFVSIRAAKFKAGKDGIDADFNAQEREVNAKVQSVATAAQERADEVKEPGV